MWYHGHQTARKRERATERGDSVSVVALWELRDSSVALGWESGNGGVLVPSRLILHKPKVCQVDEWLV